MRIDYSDKHRGNGRFKDTAGSAPPNKSGLEEWHGLDCDRGEINWERWGCSFYSDILALPSEENSSWDELSVQNDT